MSKRLLDILASGAGLLILSPAMIGIALAVYLSSPGPYLFRQRRVGRYGKTFTIYKFRTMRTQLAGTDGPSITAQGDSRVTRCGAILRRYKLDELPQLWNVLRGDMSLVGPRPEVPKYVALYTERESRVLDVRPGITCVSSLELFEEEAELAASPDPESHYREVIMPAKIAAACKYASAATVWTDLLVLSRTVARIAQSLCAFDLEGSSPRGPGMGNAKLGSAWMAVARVAAITAQLAILVLIAICFGGVDVGRYVFMNAVAAPIFMLCNLQLRVLYATDTTAEFRNSEYWQVRLLGIAVAASLASLLGSALFGESIGVWLASAIVAVKSAESIGDLLFGRLQSCNRSDLIAICLIVRTVAYLGVFATAALFTGSLELSCFAAAAALASCVLGLELSLAQRIDPPRSGASKRLGRYSLVRRAAPLGLATALMSLSYNTPRYAIAVLAGPQALGEVAAALQLVPTCQAIAAAMCFPLVPAIAATARSQGYIAAHRLGRHSLLRLGLAGAFAAVLIGLAAPAAIVAAFGAPFAVGHLFAAGIGVAAGMQFLVTGMTSILRGLQLFGTVLRAEAIILALNVAASFGLVGLFGINSIALASGIVASLAVAVYAWLHPAPPASASTTPHLLKAA